MARLPLDYNKLPIKIKNYQFLNSFYLLQAEDNSMYRLYEISSTDYKTLLDSSIIIRSFSSKSKKDKTNLMVYKNKSLDKNGVVLSEEKISTTVENLDNTLKILKLAGLNNWLSLNQQNSFYKLGEIEITVGTVKGLDGPFLEIEEYPSIKDKKEEDKFTILSNLAKSLNINLGEDYSVKKPYLFLKKH